MIEIDGAQGEGGGQILRTSLALSILSGQAVRLFNIRQGRSKPGLAAQHAAAVDAAAAVSRAEVEGVRLGSTELVFRPGEVRSGRYKFDIGTAGSTSLVLQTVFLPLSQARSASSLIITGGTHVPWSPSFHYIEQHWLPFMRRMGFDTQLTLDQAGFYPQGGGRISAVIRPAGGRPAPLQLDRRGKLVRIRGLAAVANLDLSIADRMRRQALARLGSAGEVGPAADVKIKALNLPARFKGAFLHLLAEFEQGGGCYWALGELGKPAERVADEAVDGLLAFLETDGVVDPYLADQLLLPLALASGPSAMRTARVNAHLLTNAEIIRRFLPVEIGVEGEAGQPGLVTIRPAKA